MRYFDPDGAPFRITMGLRRLDPADWIEVDDDYRRDLALKRELLADRPGDVAGFLPEGERGSAEARSLLEQHMARHFPGLGDPAAGPAGQASGEPPLVAAARIVQEDLCVMHRRGTLWVLAAAVVCFPSRWSLREKLGADLTAIHEPVPDYSARIATPTEKFFDRLATDRPMWRLNWTLLADPALFQPAGSPLPADVAPADLTVRVERQTLRRLPESGDVLFTIRTYRGRLADVLAQRPGSAADLAATLRTVGADYAAYRGWTDILPELLAWLSRPPGEQDGATAPDPVPKGARRDEC